MKNTLISRKAKRRVSESQMQSACVYWFRLQYRKLAKLLIAVPNGAVLKGDAKERGQQMNRLKKEGLVVGAADLILLVPSGDCGFLCLEAKTETGKQTDNQKAFEKAVIETGVGGYAIFRSLEEFQNIIKTYLETGEY